MGSNKYESLLTDLLSLAGIEVNGRNPWDIQVHDARFYKRAIGEVELGLGESYMNGWWDVEKLDEMIYRIIRADLQKIISQTRNPHT